MSCTLSLYSSLYDTGGKYCHDISTAVKEKKEQCDAVGFIQSNKKPIDSLKMQKKMLVCSCQRILQLNLALGSTHSCSGSWQFGRKYSPLHGFLKDVLGYLFPQRCVHNIFIYFTVETVYFKILVPSLLQLFLSRLGSLRDEEQVY